MNINDLEKAGAFVQKGTEQKTVVWKNDEGGEFTFVIHIKKMSAGDYEQFIRAFNSDNSSFQASAISSILTDSENGSAPLMTYEQAYQLAPSLSKLFIDAINEVYSPKN